MKPFTNDRSCINRVAKQLTDRFLEEFGYRCWFCGTHDPYRVHVHHMASGIGNKPLAMLDRSTWASACDECNCGPLCDKGEESGEWPILRQLAVKAVMDPEHLRLKAFNRLRGHAEDFITKKDLQPLIPRERRRLRKLGLLR